MLGSHRETQVLRPVKSDVFEWRTGGLSKSDRVYGTGALIFSAACILTTQTELSTWLSEVL